MSTNWICTLEQAREADDRAIHDFNIPSLLLMEHAAQGCVERLIKKIPRTSKGLIICGPGNNGADGLAMARILQEKGYNIEVIVPFEEKISGEERIQFDMIQSLLIPYHFLNEALDLNRFDYIVDAIFGTGLSRPITGVWHDMIFSINTCPGPVFSVDIPSGLDGNSGKVFGIAVKANETFVLDCLKWGEISVDGALYCGNLQLIKIGIPQCLHATHPQILAPENLIPPFPIRSSFGHKGSFGKALMIGGSAEMPGAITMASEACFHSGIGLLSVFVPYSIASILQTRSPFIMSIRGPEDNGHFSKEAIDCLERILDQYTVFSIGNGMHKNEITNQLTDVVLQSKKTVVIDADSLIALKDHGSWLDRDAITILTPHMKEMADLCGISLEELKKCPYDIVKTFCLEHPNCVLVLKSSFTIIGHQDQLRVLYVPNNSLSKGGSGDVLCGIITGACGWIKDAFLAAQYGVMVHCLAAPHDEIGFTPLDLIRNLNTVWNALKKGNHI